MILYINTDGGNATVETAGTLVKTASACVMSFDPIDLEDQNQQRTFVASKSITGKGTTNTAEYKGVLLALLDMDVLLEKYPEVDTVHFYLDSQLVCYQINGRYRVREAQLKPLHSNVKDLELLYPWITFDYSWIRREFNVEADKLCGWAKRDRIKTDLFQSLSDFFEVAPLPMKATSLGQKFHAGMLSGKVSCKFDVENYEPLCDGCGQGWDTCKCPRLERVDGCEEAIA